MLKRVASCQLLAYSSRTEAAEISKEHGAIAGYHDRIGNAYRDHSAYHVSLAWASMAVGNWDGVLSDCKEGLSLTETALEHFNKSLRTEFNQIVENHRKVCLGEIELAISVIQEVESQTTCIKTTGAPSLSIDVTADNPRQDTYSRVMLRIVNGGDGVAKDVKIRLDAPVEGETAASLEMMKQEYETGLVLSVKPLEHGRMKFKIYAEYMDMQGRRDTATGEAWVQVARLTKEPAGQQVFHIGNFTGEIGLDEQAAGGRTR